MASWQPAAVGQRAGQHDPALGHELGRRRRRRQLLPELVDRRHRLRRPVAVHQHGMLLDRVRQLDERLELGRRGVEVARAGTARGRSARGRDARVGKCVAHRPQGAQRVPVATSRERVRRREQLLVVERHRAAHRAAAPRTRCRPAPCAGAGRFGPGAVRPASPALPPSAGPSLADDPQRRTDGRCAGRSGWLVTLPRPCRPLRRTIGTEPVTSAGAALRRDGRRSACGCPRPVPGGRSPAPAPGPDPASPVVRPARPAHSPTSRRPGSDPSAGRPFAPVDRRAVAVRQRVAAARSGPGVADRLPRIASPSGPRPPPRPARPRIAPAVAPCPGSAPRRTARGSAARAGCHARAASSAGPTPPPGRRPARPGRRSRAGTSSPPRIHSSRTGLPGTTLARCRAASRVRRRPRRPSAERTGRIAIVRRTSPAAKSPAANATKRPGLPQGRRRRSD